VTMKNSNTYAPVPVIAIQDDDLSYQGKPLCMRFEEHRLDELGAMSYHSWRDVSIRFSFLSGKQCCLRAANCLFPSLAFPQRLNQAMPCGLIMAKALARSPAEPPPTRETPTVHLVSPASKAVRFKSDIEELRSFYKEDPPDVIRFVEHRSTQ
jgi:hypothetical protein